MVYMNVAVMTWLAPGKRCSTHGQNGARSESRDLDFLSHHDRIRGGEPYIDDKLHLDTSGRIRRCMATRNELCVQFGKTADVAQFFETEPGTL